MAADNMDRMVEPGTVLYTDLTNRLVAHNANPLGGDRPLWFGLKGEALQARIEELLAVRAPVYRRAHLQAPAMDSPGETARGIASLLGVQVK